MKTALNLTVLGLLLAGFPALAQTPRVNHWDISKIDVSKLPPASDQTDVAFDKDILPLLKASCVRCHGEQKPRGGLRLDTQEGVLKGGRDGKMVVPGDSKNSLLVAAAARIDDNIAMPPKRGPRGGPGGPPSVPPNGLPGGPAPGGPAGGPSLGTPPPRPAAKPLTAAQVGLLRAWIDQGAK
jgi:hypothetical protein